MCDSLRECKNINGDKKMKFQEGRTHTFINTRVFVYIQGVPGGMDKTSGECSLG